MTKIYNINVTLPLEMRVKIFWKLATYSTKTLIDRPKNISLMPLYLERYSIRKEHFRYIVHRIVRNWITDSRYLTPR